MTAIIPRINPYITNNMYQVHQQSIRTMFVRIYLMNKYGRKVDRLEGVVIDGSYSMDSQSTIRRICNLKMIIKDSSYIPKEGSKFWLNSRFSLEIGIKSMISDEIEYISQGIFVMDSPSLVYNNTTKIVSIKGLDLMCLLNGNRNGKLPKGINIPAGKNVRQAVYDIITEIGWIKTSMTDSTDNVVPSNLSFTRDDTYEDVLVKLRDLFPDWEFFFDGQGYFIFQQIRNKTNDPKMYDFSEDKCITTEYQLDLDWQKIKNKIVVFGSLLTDGIQVMSTLINDNPLSPFNINKIGEIQLFISDNSIFTQDQADIRAKYELWKNGNFNDKITITCLPIYYLEVNRVIHVTNEELGIDMDFLIDTIDCGLKFDSLMSITAYNILGHNFYN